MTKHHVANKPRSTSSAGFTIIETLIVLIIAGLFLLIVFEALPALARSSRNNQRKQDVQAILEVVSQYELNKSGDFPPDCGYSPFPACVGSGNLLQNASLSFYNPLTDLQTNIQVYNQQNTNSGGASYAIDLLPLPKQSIKSPNAGDQVNVYNYERCDTNGDGGATSGSAGYNDVVALYAIESGSSAVSGVCQQL
jgi:type II secretory pathway pseudopilin PulG